MNSGRRLWLYTILAIVPIAAALVFTNNFVKNVFHSNAFYPLVIGFMLVLLLLNYFRKRAQLNNNQG